MVALRGFDLLRFQRAKTVFAPSVQFRVFLSRDTRPFKPRILSTCEKTCTAGSGVVAGRIRADVAHHPGGSGMKSHPFSIGNLSRCVLCITSLLLCGQHVWASDVPVSRGSAAAEEASSSASPISQTVPGTEGKIEKSGKYDVDRIGQRSIGRGVNLYSLQKERALGQSMASAIDH